MSSSSRHRYARVHDDGADNRSSAQRDRDRVLYSSAFQRLVEVTQVVSPDEGHVFHNRLTHSLKVAQVARRIAERLKFSSRRPSLDLDPDVVEAAALAHDLGHPPFGHIAEEELDEAVSTECHVPDGFNGNAQSFRIVTTLALRCDEYTGLNLTRATLNAILKYPWRRGTQGRTAKKWGAYSTEQEVFRFAREGFSGGVDERCLEASIMDCADDITYAVHDVVDFFRAGLIPLHRFTESRRLEMDRFLDEVFTRERELADRKRDCKRSFANWAVALPFQHPYADTVADRSILRNFTAGLIGGYIKRGTSLSRTNPPVLVIDPAVELELAMLKQLTWHYVIVNPALATQQFGQRRVIRSLFRVFMDAANSKSRAIFPVAFREALKDADRTLAGEALEAAHSRAVCDYIAGMTERQALALHLKLTGERPGSGLR